MVSYSQRKATGQTPLLVRRERSDIRRAKVQPYSNAELRSHVPSCDPIQPPYSRIAQRRREPDQKPDARGRWSIPRRNERAESYLRNDEQNGSIQIVTSIKRIVIALG